MRMLHFLSHVQSILMRETSRTDGISKIHCEGDVHRAMSDCPSGCSALGGLEFRHGSDLELPVVEWRSTACVFVLSMLMCSAGPSPKSPISRSLR